MDFSTDLFLEYKKRPGRAALARLLERHQDAVYTLCRQVLRHPQDAEDACQEILLEVSRQVDSIDDPAKFPGWLYRTALHTALDLKRQRGRRKVREAGATAVAASGPGPEAAEALHEGLAGLDDTSRMLVVEHYFGRRPLRELAAERGVSEVAVWKRLSSARERLKKVLGSASVAALDGIVKVSAPAGMVPKALGIAGGLAMKIGIKAAIVAPLVLLTGIGTVAYVRRPDPPPPPPLQARKADVRRAAPSVLPGPPVAAAAVAPASPSAKQTAPRTRKPYPFNGSTSGHPAAAVNTWLTLSTKRITLDCQNEPLPELLRQVAQLTGVSLTPAPGLEQELISFKVQDIVGDGALRLMLQPRDKEYEILPDGTVRIDVKERIRGGYEVVGRGELMRRYELDHVRGELDGGWDGVGRQDPWAEFHRRVAEERIVSTQGETTLGDELERLRALGFSIHVESSGGSGVGVGTQRPQTTKRFLQVVTERSIEEHVRDLARINGLTAVQYNGQFVLTSEKSAGAYMAQSEEPRKQHRQLLELLQQPVGLSGTSNVPDLLDHVGRSHGLAVVPTEDAWNNPAMLSFPPGTTLRQALDQLKGQGLRWAARDGKLFVLSR